jgi:hypothetical protein
MSRENQKPETIERQPLDAIEEDTHSRGRWVYHILKVVIGVLLYKVLFAAAPYLKNFIKNFS